MGCFQHTRAPSVPRRADASPPVCARLALQGGIYQGRILMPAEYPFKPPAFVMLTPSGRFETGTKICLSISSHHPESWQPSWSVRSALVALIAFMQTPGSGALGSLDHPAHLRQQMAAESRVRAPVYGSEARQQLIQRMHARLLELEPQSRQLYKRDAVEEQGGPQEGGEAAGQEGVEEEEEAPATPAPVATNFVAPEGAAPAVETPARAQGEPAGVATSAPPAPGASPADASPAAAAREGTAAAAAVAAAAAPRAAESAGGPPAAVVDEQPREHAGVAPLHQQGHHSWEDRGLTYLAMLLGVLILALLIRKVLPALCWGLLQNFLLGALSQCQRASLSLAPALSLCHHHFQPTLPPRGPWPSPPAGAGGHLALQDQ